MSARQSILNRFRGRPVTGPTFLPDLVTWYSWHSSRDSLPERWRALSLDDICRDLSVPVWRPARPWTMQSVFDATVSIVGDRKTVSLDVDGHVLTAAWTVGPDGDWWQADYLAGSADDLNALLAYVESRTFTADAAAVDEIAREAGDDGLVAVELPARPFSWLMLEVLGWSDGLMLLLDERDLVDRIVAAADAQIQELVRELSGCTDLFYSPDNLDAQFISPAYFSEFLADSYSTSAARIAENGGHLVVHAGGPVRVLLPALDRAGVSGVVGVCGPPQGDSDLVVAREAAGENLLLAGGIPQDYLVPSVEITRLEQSIGEVIRVCERDPRVIAGIADHVPIEADPDRLALVAQAFNQA